MYCRKKFFDEAAPPSRINISCPLRIFIELTREAGVRFFGNKIRLHGNLGTMTTISLLTISNIFMTFAWYGHLKFRDPPLFKMIVISWGIAFFEYFQVPANRIGSY